MPSRMLESAVNCVPCQLPHYEGSSAVVLFFVVRLQEPSLCFPELLFARLFCHSREITTRDRVRDISPFMTADVSQPKDEPLQSRYL